MQKHKEDGSDGDQAQIQIERPQGSADPRDKWLAAGANDDLAFLMAMLALAEGGGKEEPTDRHTALPRKETSHGRAEDQPRDRQASGTET